MNIRYTLIRALTSVVASMGVLVFSAGLMINLLTFNITTAEGMQIYYADQTNSTTLDTVSELETLFTTENQFLLSTNDILSSLPDIQGLNHYGDEEVNWNIQWWDDDTDTSTPYNWRYRRCATITNPNTFSISEYQVYTTIDTQSLIAGGKMNSDGDDIRFVSSSQVEYPYYISNASNTSSTGIYIQIPTIAANETQIVCMYYGYVGSNPLVSASDSDTVFSFSSPQALYYPIHRRSGSSTTVGAYEDNTTVNQTSTFTLTNEYDINTYTNTNISQPFVTTKPLSIAFNLDANEAAIPISWAGTEFVTRAYRNTEEWNFLAPYNPASVTIQEHNGTNWVNLSTNNVPVGVSTNVVQNTNNARAIRILSTEPILVSHMKTNNRDTMIMYPTSKAYNDNIGLFELYGINSRFLQLAGTVNGCQAVIYRSDGSTTNVTFTNANRLSYTETDLRQGTGFSYRITSNCPIGANASADSDGLESQTLLPAREFATRFLLPQNTQYIAVTSNEPSNICTVYNPDDTIAETNTLGSLPSPLPNKGYFGSENNVVSFVAGSYMECTKPATAYYEYINGGISDETMLLTPTQARLDVQNPPLITDIDISNEEGLYFESGRVSGNAVSYSQLVIDNSVNQVSSVSIRSIINTGAEVNGVDSYIVSYSSANPAICDNTTAFGSFTSASTLASYSETIVTDTPFTGFSIQDIDITFSLPNVTDSCVALRIEYQTGDEQYTSFTDTIEFSTIEYTLLNGNLQNPTVTLPLSATLTDRIVFKVTGASNNAHCAIGFENGGVSENAVNPSSYSFIDSSSTVTFALNQPIFPLTNSPDYGPPTNKIVCDQEILISHSYQTSTNATINITIKEFLENSDQIYSTRNITLQYQ